MNKLVKKMYFRYFALLVSFILTGIVIFDSGKSIGNDQNSKLVSSRIPKNSENKNVERLLQKRIMIHQPLGGAQGQATDIEAQAKEILYIKGKINGLLSKFTGQSVKRIETDTERDFWMSAQEAKAYGIIDQVIIKLP
jgi:ATP-dependent Clp endopeptidase proteolytic subunit ClpP